MSLTIAQADYFWADLQRQVDWYRDRAGSEIATNYVDAVEATLQPKRCVFRKTQSKSPTAGICS